jgi:hypothetical protein
MTEMPMNDDGFSPSRRTLPYLDLDEVTREEPRPRDSRANALETEAAGRIEADVLEIKETLGRPPAPGRPGSGLVGAVVEMQRTIERLVTAEEARAKTSTPPLVSKRTAIALVTAIVGSGGVAGIIHAATGNAPPAVQQQQQQPPRGP